MGSNLSSSLLGPGQAASRDFLVSKTPTEGNGSEALRRSHRIHSTVAWCPVRPQDKRVTGAVMGMADHSPPNIAADAPTLPEGSASNARQDS